MSFSGLKKQFNKANQVIHSLCLLFLKTHLYLIFKNGFHLFEICNFTVFFTFWFQYLSETMGAAEATKLDDDYTEMEKVSFFFVVLKAYIFWCCSFAMRTLFATECLI